MWRLWPMQPQSAGQPVARPAIPAPAEWRRAPTDSPARQQIFGQVFATQSPPPCVSGCANAEALYAARNDRTNASYQLSAISYQLSAISRQLSGVSYVGECADKINRL